MKLYYCELCGNIITKLTDNNTISCCGSEMKELLPNTVEASTEKHIPIVEINNNTVNIKVGEVLHPMTEEHYIQFIIIETENGFCVRKLNPIDSPEINSHFNSKVLNVYAYCNLHGLWKASF